MNNENVENVENVENAFVFIYPKRLVLINQKWCDFCNKQSNDSYTKELIYLFGYQTCKNCRNICQKQIDIYCKYNKEYSTIDFIRDFGLSGVKFNIQRTSGIIENNWEIDFTQFIKVRDNKYLIPMHALHIFKYVDLNILCNYNKEIIDYNAIHKYFYDYFKTSVV